MGGVGSSDFSKLRGECGGQFTERQLKRLSRHFNDITPSHNRMNKRLFLQGLRECGIEGTDLVVSLFEAFDKDGSGEIDFRELVLALTMFTQASVDDVLHVTFQVLDLKGDGVITAAEMKTALTTMNRALVGDDDSGFVLMTEQDYEREIGRFVDEVFSEFDTNCDGKLNLDEFRQCAKKHPFLIKLTSQLVTDAAAPFLRGQRAPL